MIISLFILDYLFLLRVPNTVDDDFRYFYREPGSVYLSVFHQKLKYEEESMYKNYVYYTQHAMQIQGYGEW